MWGAWANAATGSTARASMVVEPAVPMSHRQFPPLGEVAGMEEQFAGADSPPLQRPVAQPGHSFDGLQVLGA